MRKALLTAALLLPVLAQAQVKLLRHPAYSKGKVAFSYLGDIWIANENGSEVQRLTDNRARDVYPRFCPDGTMIAFWSQAVSSAPAELTVVVKVGDWTEADWSPYFSGCHTVATIDNGLGIPNQEQGQHISVCTGLRQSWTAIWPHLRHLD